MKLRQLLFILSLLMSGHAASAVSISVNTTTDEFGENPAACSLREAIEAINIRSPFGGCKAGERFGLNRIILEEKEYVLTRGELVVKQEMAILGYYENNLIDSITQLRPKRVAPTTVINGQFKSRLFTTAQSKVALTLNHLKLLNGYTPEYGGAVLAGGTLETFNILFENNKADIMGGAVHLLGGVSALSSGSTTWTQNATQAGTGAALSMSCLSELQSTQRTINILNNSIITNGSTNDKSIIEACGHLTLDIQQSTIANNTANHSGAIIHFNNNTSAQSNISIKNTTIINNHGAPALELNIIDSIQVNGSIIAFNQGGSCSSSVSNIDYIGNNNLYQNCQVLNLPSTTNNSHSDDQHLSNTSPVSWTDLFNPLGNYGGYTPVYLPKVNALSKAYVIDKIKLDSCLDYIDQRDSSTHSTNNVENCDRGSVERRVAIAVVDQTAVFSNRDKSDRIIEMNVLENDTPSETDLTEEHENARGAFAKDAQGNYQLKLKPDSLCTIRHRGDQLPYVKFENGGKLLTELQRVSCEYTFIDTNGNEAIPGELFFKIENKIPIAGNDTFRLAAGANTISMNLIVNDNDENDGKYGGLCTANTVQCNGGYYLRITSAPSIGTLEGDSRPCPDHNDTNKYMCYRGDIVYRAKNNLSPFNDSFTYVVYDNDLGFSEAATVNIISENGENAQDTGGSLAWWSILTLTGLAVYRRRKAQIA